MRRPPSSSARTVALAAVVCALSIAPGCKRESFDLLADESLAIAGSGLSAGGLDLGGGGRAGASGKAGGGGAGKASGGFGGRFSGAAGGGTGSFPCLGEGGCPDEEPFCPSPSPFCLGCTSDPDCEQGYGDAKVCDTELKRCVQCRRDSDCTGTRQACNLRTQRCETACERNFDCSGDSKHPLCNQEFHACVACNEEGDCGPKLHCFLYSCVECIDERQCTITQACYGGHCTKR